MFKQKLLHLLNSLQWAFEVYTANKQMLKQN